MVSLSLPGSVSTPVRKLRQAGAESPGIGRLPISDSLGRMLHLKGAPRTSYAIRWEEGIGAGETVGLITAKRCFSGVRSAQTTFAPGPPPMTSHTAFDPSLRSPSLVSMQASPAEITAIQSQHWARSIHCSRQGSISVRERSESTYESHRGRSSPQLATR
jgi:hypothetical protein